MKDEKSRLDEIKRVNVTFDQYFNKRRSLLLKISIIYLFITSFILMFFLVATTSNQIQLISEKAVKSTEATAYELFRRLEPIIQNNKFNKKIYRKIIDRLKLFKENNRLIISDFAIVSSKGKILFSYPQKSFRKYAGGEDGQLPGNTKIKVLKALKLKELKEQPFLGIPDIDTYNVEIFIPIKKVSKKNKKGAVFWTSFQMEDIEKEVSSLINLGYLMVIIVLLSQAGIGSILYKILLIPIKKLAEGAHSVSKGDLKVEIPLKNDSDELGRLTYLFNKMVGSLNEKTGKLNMTILELERRNSIVQNELNMARNIQKGIMPGNNSLNEIEYNIYYSPLEKVSGDYYDIFKLDNDRIGILICDASGHGIPAALVTIMAQVYFSKAFSKFAKPGELLNFINKQLSTSIVTSDYLTAFYLILSMSDLKLYYSNASHQKALILRNTSNGKKIEELDSQGFFIGALKEVPFPYETKETTLGSKDRLILYTDGIVEGMNAKKEEYGMERFIEKIKEYSDLPVEEFNKKIIEDIDSFADGILRRDDYTLFSIDTKLKN